MPLIQFSYLYQDNIFAIKITLYIAESATATKTDTAYIKKTRDLNQYLDRKSKTEIASFMSSYSYCSRNRGCGDLKCGTDSESCGAIHTQLTPDSTAPFLARAGGTHVQVENGRKNCHLGT